MISSSFTVMKIISYINESPKNFDFFFGLISAVCTDKSLSEALIFASTNTQYDDRLFIELRVQYMKIPSSEHVVYTNCFVFVLTLRTIYVHNMFSTCCEVEIFMYWTRDSMNNLLSYCGLVDTKIRASDKDLPVDFLSSMSVTVKH